MGYSSIQLLKNTQDRVAAAGFILTLLLVLLYFFKPPFFVLLDLKLYDQILQRSHSKTLSGKIVIVDIDTASLEEFGQWPWPRYRIADLLQKINTAQPLAVGLDILFAEPDRASPAVLKNALKKDYGVDVKFSGLPDNLMDNDRLLADILKSGPFILGYAADFSGRDPTSRAPSIPEMKVNERAVSGAGPANHYLIAVKDLDAPLPVLLDNTGDAGFMNTITDRDGVLRRTPLLISWKGKIYPQLSLATALVALQSGVDDPMILTDPQGIEALVINETRIPLDERGCLRINYRGPRRTFPYIPVSDVLNNRVQPEQLKDKIIFIGTSASGLMDIRISPLDSVQPGVEVHATIVDNILNKDFIQRPDMMMGVEVVILIVWGLITALIISRTGSLLTLPVTVLLGIGIWYGSLWSLGSQKIWLSPLFPILSLMLNFAVLNLLKFRMADEKKKFFKTAFSKYVSKSVVNQMVANPDKLSLAGEEKPISVLFSDIREFTTISEQLTPSEISLLLHDYFTAVTRIIIRNAGTHDKFIGDAVMSFWNAPVDVPDHERKALISALEIIKELDNLNIEFEKQFGVTIAIGIGLHSGMCRVGNMGSDDIFDYTVIGDTVNLASRLESLTKYYGEKILISEQMLTGIPPEIVPLEIDLVRVKGKDKPVRIYTVFSGRHSLPAPEPQEIDRYKEALEHYKNRRFEIGREMFQELAQASPDKKLYSVYRDRCDAMCTTPPPGSWDGVYTHKFK